MPKGEIVLTEIQETQYGEEAVIDSPFEAKDYIKVLPWDTYANEVNQYGSLREKAQDRADGQLSDSMRAALDAVEAYDEFDDEFATHASWDGQKNAWTIDADAFDEARKFWEYVGFNVSVDGSVSHPSI